MQTHQEHKYTNSTEGPFKTRYNGHTQIFRTENKKDSTALSQYIWTNNLNPNPTVKWKLLVKTQPYTPGQTYCQLCISEKL